MATRLDGDQQLGILGLVRVKSKVPSRTESIRADIPGWITRLMMPAHQEVDTYQRQHLVREPASQGMGVGKDNCQPGQAVPSSSKDWKNWMKKLPGRRSR